MSDPSAAFVIPGATRLSIGSRTYDVARKSLVMGIVNRTPDSFFDNGRYFDLDACSAHAEDLVAAGADIIDVGGVRAGPGAEVSVDEEIDRVVPVIDRLRRHCDVPVSVDTYNASVAEAAFVAGASIGNDISGFADPEYLPAAARHGATVVATHIRLLPRVDDPNPIYPGNDVVSSVLEALKAARDRALACGVADDRIIVDAGLDLGKTTAHSLELLRRSDDLQAVGAPVLLAASNKDFLGETCGLSIDERQEASLAAVALGFMLGCRVMRVHDVRRTRRVLAVLEAVLGP